MKREELAILIKENNNHLKINALRTSADGGLGDAVNYWTATSVILCTDIGNIRLSSSETSRFDSLEWFSIDEPEKFSIKEYPFVVHATEREEIYLEDYYLSEWLDELILVYDNCRVSVTTEGFWGGVGLSLQGDETDETHLEYIDYEYSYTWDFRDERVQEIGN